jgi:hypothetical protein
MSELKDLSTTDASNNDASFGFPENMNPSAVNNNMRAILGAIARDFNDRNGTLVSAGTAPTWTIASPNVSLSTSYSDGQVFVFHAHEASGNSNTLNISSKGAKPIFKPNGVTVSSSDIITNQAVMVAFDQTVDGWNMLSPLSGKAASGALQASNNLSDVDNAATSLSNIGGIGSLAADTTPQLGGLLDTNSKSINFSLGANVASATDTDIWGGEDGNVVHITGTTTIADFGTPNQAGDHMWCIFDGVVTITDSATLTVSGNTDYTTAANDLVLVVALTTSTFLVTPFPNSGGSPVAAGGGKILQVVTAERSTQTAYTNTSYASTGHTCSLTPSNSSNKILVQATVSMGQGGTGQQSEVVMYRDIGGGGYSVLAGTHAAHVDVGGVYHYDYSPILFLDSPATTSAVSYRLYIRTDTGTLYYSSNSGDATNDKSNIVLMEIDGT